MKLQKNRDQGIFFNGSVVYFVNPGFGPRWDSNPAPISRPVSV